MYLFTKESILDNLSISILQECHQETESRKLVDDEMESVSTGNLPLLDNSLVQYNSIN